MFDRLTTLFGSDDDASARAGDRPVDELQLAAAVLLIEAARMDDAYEAGERSMIEKLLRERFSLDDGEVEVLLRAADAAAAESVELYGYARRIKDAFDENERIRMIEMLWEVAYADGEIHDLEANLLRRVAGLIYVSDRESGEARKRVLDRSGGAS